MNPLKEKPAQILVGALQDIGIEENINTIYQNMSYPPKAEMGHFAFPCFTYARQLRMAPFKIAKNLIEQINFTENPFVARASVAGGYANFFLKSAALGQETCTRILTNKFFSEKGAANGKRVMIEYSQPNTHKEIHVGHMRNLCLGDALIKLGQYCGQQVTSTTFPGDMGTHVAKCLWYFKYRNSEHPPTENKGAWLGKMYAKGNLTLIDESADEAQEAQNKEQMSAILSEIESEQGEFYDLWKTTRAWSIELMEKTYAWAKVKFEKWYWESEVDVPSIELVKKLYEQGITYTANDGTQKPVFTRSRGAIIADLTDVDLGVCVLIKSDGHGLYATKDIELARRKFEDYHIQQSIYVVDERQSHHFNQVFEILKRIGYKNAENCYHLKYNYVELPTGAMSSRKGNVVPLMKLIEKMRAKILDNYEERGQQDVPEIENLSDIIARGAIKYGMLKIDPSKKIVFEMDEWLRIDGDSGVYLQYTHARIRSMLEKYASAGNLLKSDWSVLNNSHEQNLMIALANFNEVCHNTLREYKPNILCNYLYKLCRLYNSFYNALPIGKAVVESEKMARLGLSKSVAEVLKQGLALLGIEAPNRM